MRILELYSGTGSLARAARAQGHEAVTLDICPRHNPTICVSILEWDHSVYPGGGVLQQYHTLDMLHSIPPDLCSEILAQVEAIVATR